MSPVSVSLQFGLSGRFECQLPTEQVAFVRRSPRCCGDTAAAAERTLQAPIDFPPLKHAVVDDDKIAIALDRQTPGAPAIIAEIWKILAARNVPPANVTILQPASLTKLPEPDPLALLPENVRSEITYKVHDPTDAASCSFLAKVSNGDDIYLARELVDAGLVIPVGVAAFDPILGFRGTNSVLYPGLSNLDALKRSLGLTHQELSPNNIRPMRQIIDEIAWLMGIQFSVQVTPASNHEPYEVISGESDSVMKRCKAQLAHNWLVSVPRRLKTVVVSVSHDASGHGWHQLTAAIACAEQLVEGGGEIVVLSELKETPGDGINMLKRFQHADECLPALLEFKPLDFVQAARLVTAARRARIYLVSQLDPALVEDLFMVPLNNLKEVERLVKKSASCGFIEAAQHAFGVVD